MVVCGRATEAFLRTLLKLDHGLPSHDAVSDGSQALTPRGFKQLCCGWQDDGGDDVMVIDGTALRRSLTEASKRCPFLWSRPVLRKSVWFLVQSGSRTNPMQ